MSKATGKMATAAVRRGLGLGVGARCASFASAMQCRQAVPAVRSVLRTLPSARGLHGVGQERRQRPLPLGAFAPRGLPLPGTGAFAAAARGFSTGTAPRKDDAGAGAGADAWQQLSAPAGDAAVDGGATEAAKAALDFAITVPGGEVGAAPCLPAAQKRSARRRRVCVCVCVCWGWWWGAVVVVGTS